MYVLNARAGCVKYTTNTDQIRHQVRHEEVEEMRFKYGAYLTAFAPYLLAYLSGYLFGSRCGGVSTYAYLMRTCVCAKYIHRKYTLNTAKYVYWWKNIPTLEGKRPTYPGGSAAPGIASADTNGPARGLSS